MPVFRLVLTLLSFLMPVVASAGEIAGRDLPKPFDGKLNHVRTLPADFDHLRLALSFDWEDERVDGTATHRFRSVRDDFKMLTLDAVNLKIESVTDGAGADLTYRSFDDRVEIDLAKPLARGEKGTVEIRYSCHPEKGIYFVNPIKGYPERTRSVWALDGIDEIDPFLRLA